MTARNLAEWQNFVQGCIDFRPNDGVYRIARDMFTEPELFELEMELIFEKVWIYACHESEIPNNNDFLTVQIGRQPMIISRDGKGELHAMVNACEYRGATLTRVAKGNQSVFTCPFHAWCYKSDGRLVKVKAPGEYCDDFDKSSRGLKQGRIASYRGFVFVSLDTQATDSLEDFLGDAKIFLDLMVDQSPTGELEVLQGKSAYTFAGNWKLQNENGLDGYHVSTVHYNYVSTVQHRQQVNAAKGGELDTLDYSKLGAGDAETDDGWFSFKHGHSVLFSDMPNPTVRPGYDTVMPYMVEKFGAKHAEWAMHRLRNLNLYPSLFFMDQISSQLRIVRPVAWNKTEVISQCIGVKGESAEARRNRFEQQAKKLHFSADDIHDAKYAFCALIDETIVTQQDPSFFHLQNAWLISPLQLSLFGSQLAGYQFFEILEQLRSKGKARLASLEVFHYCLLLGFQGKYRIESIESLNHLVARVGDEIDYLKGKKAAFSPFAAIPDQIRNMIHGELPFFWILIILLIFALLSFGGLKYMLGHQANSSLAPYQNVVSAPAEEAHITIYLP